MPHRPGPAHVPSPTPAADAASAAALAAALILTATAALAWLAGNLTAVLLGSDPWTASNPVDALLHPDRLWPHTARPALLAACTALPALAATAASAATVRLWLRHRGHRHGLATRRDLAALLPKQTAARSRQLRPSLAHTKAPAAADTGVLIGSLLPGRTEIRASWEDVLLAIMAPRSGKTSCLAVPAILDAPGPVLLTSNKAARDAYTATLHARSRAGTTWTLDPQRIAHAPRAMWWNALADARTLEGARRLAGHFVTASVDESAQGDFWSTAAQNTLTALFLAAARARRPITDVLAWLAAPADRTPVDALRENGLDAVAAQLLGTVSGAVETRDGIFETARQYAACLLDPAVAAWVTPQRNVPEFDPAAFVRSRDTLYLLSKDGGGSASALIAAAADAVMRAAVAQAERDGGRLDPPMLAVLDEAANVCRIRDLPDLYSHLGSRGVIPVTILQSYRQGVRVWGEVGMDALWSAATAKLIGSGIDDADVADKLSRLIGDHEVPTTTRSAGESGASASVSTRTERVMPPDAIRALPKGEALFFATGLRAARVALHPWYRRAGAERLAAASEKATAAITARARAASP